MNKKIFNRKQFFQTFMQLKTVGIIFTMILLVMMIMPPVSNMMDIKRYMEYAGAGEINLPQVISTMAENIILLLTFIIYTPVLTLMSWNFMTKRNASDFYHSLPYTRVCTYLTHVAAIVAWQMITLLITGIASFITYTLLSNYFIVDFPAMLHMILNVFGCNLLCMAGITVACGLTGTLFSNVCVSGLILFLPRILIEIVSSVAVAVVPVLSAEHLFSLLGSGYNILTETIFSVVKNNVSLSTLYLSNNGLIYMILLSIIYLVIGGFLFHKRKSETAGNGAYSKLIQIIIRIVIGFVFSYIGVLTLFTSYRRGELNSQTVLSAFILFMVSIVVIMIYEAINTKSLKGAIVSIPSGIAAIILSIIAGGLTYGVLLNAEGYSPDESQVSSVVMSGKNDSYFEYDNYFTEYISNIAIKNELIEKTLCDALKENIKHLDENNHTMDYNYRSNRYAYTVGFHQGISTTYRTVYLSEVQVETIAKELQNVESYRSAMLDLPKTEDVSINIPSNSVLTAAQCEEIYNCMIEEIQAIPFTDWYEIINEQKEISYDVYILFVFSREGIIYQGKVPITHYLPKTNQLYIQKTNESGYDLDLTTHCAEMINETLAINEYKEYENDRYIQIIQYEKDSIQNYYMLEDFLESPEKKELLSKMADALYNFDVKETIDITKPYIMIEYGEISDEEYFTYDSTSVFIQID